MREGSADQLPINSAKAATSPQRKTKSAQTGATRSLEAPARSLAITGRAQHMASLTTNPKGSNSEGNTRRCAAVYTAGSCDWLTNPRNRTYEPTPSFADSDSNSGPRGTSPPKTNLPVDTL